MLMTYMEHNYACPEVSEERYRVHIFNKILRLITYIYTRASVNLSPD